MRVLLVILPDLSFIYVNLSEVENQNGPKLAISGTRLAMSIHYLLPSLCILLFDVVVRFRIILLTIYRKV